MQTHKRNFTYACACTKYEHTQAHTRTHTHADINHPAAVREKESWAVRRWLRGVGVFCSTDLLSPSLLLLLLLLFLSPLQFWYTDGYKQLSQRKKAEKSEGMVKLCYCTQSEWLRLMLLSETQLQVSLWFKSPYLIVYANKGSVRGD